MRIYLKLFFSLIGLVFVGSYGTSFFRISREQAKDIGQLILRNECGDLISNLTHWSAREDFPSFGIGHFVWYPKGLKGSQTIFEEQFPRMRQYLAKRGKRMPKALRGACPWRSRGEFLNQFESKEMRELRAFLVSTIDLQAAYIIDRFKRSINYLLNNISFLQGYHVKKQIKRLSQTPRGVYAMVDYLNFKGEGLKPSEAYNGRRWGLLPVLSMMTGKQSGDEAEHEFAQCAKDVLTDRVRNAPASRHEERWLSGWFNRIDTYHD